MTKISELPAATLPLTGTELVPLVQDAVTKQTSLNEVVGPHSIERLVVVPSGLVGNGVADETDAISAAVADVAATGGTVFLPAGRYLIRRPIFLPSKVTLRGAGIGVTTITKPPSVKSLLTVNAAVGANAVTVADASGFVLGGSIHLYDTSSVEWISTQGRIVAINGNVITFENAEGLGRIGLDGALQTGRAATATSSFPLIRNVKGSQRVRVHDLTLDQVQNANDPAPVNTAVGAQTDFTVATLHWVESYYALVENVEFLNASGDAYSDQAQDGTGVVPSAAIIKTTKNMIRGCRIRNATRHGVHIGTCMNGAFVTQNEITGCGWYAMFYCAFATNTVATANIVESCGSGFAGIDQRDYGNVISNNIIKGCALYAIEAANGDGTGGRLVISGNYISDAVSGPINLDVPDCTIVGNTIDMAGRGNSAIRLLANADRCVVEGNAVSNSGAVFSGSYGLTINGCDDVRLIGNSFRNTQRGADVRGAVRMVAVANHFSGQTAAVGWQFNTTTSTDCIIRDERNVLANPIEENVVPTRLVYERVGDNGANDPAAGGQWNGIAGRRFNGTMVRWNSGGGEKISIFYNGVGWTVLN